MNYQKLRKQYPEVITMEQFRKIAHIAKRTAKWILDNGVIPCEDSGKKTRRYKIRLDDVIIFLEKRERGAFVNVIPKGQFSNIYQKRIVHEYIDSEEMGRCLAKEWNNLPEALTVKEVQTISGYCSGSILRWIEQEKLQAVLYRNSYLVMKSSVVEFLSSMDGQSIQQKSQKHQEMITEYMAEQENSGMEFTMSL
mgnify:CR=1 FL=1